MAFNPRQARDRVGKWTSGGGLLRAATKASEESRGELVSWHKPSSKTARSRFADRRARVEEADILHYRSERGYRLTPWERSKVEWSGPTRQQLRAENKPLLQPRQMVLASARGGRSSSARDVKFNPLSGNYVAAPTIREVSSGGRLTTSRRPMSLGSAAAKKRGKLATPVYSGRHRA